MDKSIYKNFMNKPSFHISKLIQIKYVDNTIVLNEQLDNVKKLESFISHVDEVLFDVTQNEKIGIFFQVLEKVGEEIHIKDTSKEIELYQTENNTHLLNGEDVDQLVKAYIDYAKALSQNKNTTIELAYYYYQLDTNIRINNTNYFENNTSFIERSRIRGTEEYEQFKSLAINLEKEKLEKTILPSSVQIKRKL